jgi:hypothetical protein
VTGCILRYATIYPELAVILIGFGADLVAVTNFFKKFADPETNQTESKIQLDSPDSPSLTTNFYYNCVLYTCLIITLGQFGVGVWYIVAGITELAMTLITSAILMTTLSVFIKRQQASETTQTVSTQTDSKPVVIDLKTDQSSTLVEKTD